MTTYLSEEKARRARDNGHWRKSSAANDRRVDRWRDKAKKTMGWRNGKYWAAYE